MARLETPILMYHSIDPSGSVISIAPEMFRFQMENLAARGLRGTSIGDILDTWQRGQSTVGLVGITFDDGYANNLDVAAPQLDRHGFSATIFVIAGRLGMNNQWPGQGSGIPVLPLLSEQALAALPAHSFEIGAHTIDHPDLTTLPPPEVVRQMVGGRKLLEDALNRPVTTFAYPLGRATPDIVKRAAACYRASCSTHLASASPASDRAWLPRIDAFYLRSRKIFAGLGTPFVRNYIGIRRVWRAWRDPRTARPVASRIIWPCGDEAIRPENDALRSDSQ